MVYALEEIERLFADASGRVYLGDAVSIATHMLQAGALAEADGAPEELVAAALLHDVGHLIAPTSADADARHEATGADWLAALGLPESVTEPVRLHVVAKRYLCVVEPDYFEGLSTASRRSLALQGGVMSDAEARAFSARAQAAAAIAVRRWDDAAKDPAAPTPAFGHFEQLLSAYCDNR
jgi:gamma-butyrobetaine dioxygenase